MERKLSVFLDVESVPLSVGTLWTRDKGKIETSTFEYNPGWLRRQGAFSLAPRLPLGPGQFYSDSGLFNAFTDPAPDRWGQKLMRHYERQRAEQAGTRPRTLRGMDFLAGVDDRVRLGALRFKGPADENFVTISSAPVPPMVDLSKLLSAADRVEKGKERKSDLAVLLAPAGSLGGARPKATVRGIDDALYLAKFPWHQDEWPVIVWETVTLQLAASAGVNVPSFRLQTVGKKRVLLIARFDRRGMDFRIPFISAITALDAKERETRSYLELVDFLRQEGAAPEEDIIQLWRRMVFNVLVSNTDDHLRNHGFLRMGAGWRLSPAYDMNPRPIEFHERHQELALNEIDTTSSLDIALSVAGYFGLSLAAAKSIAREVATSTSTWRTQASAAGLTKDDIELMASAYEHEDLTKTLSLLQPSPQREVGSDRPKKKQASAKAKPKVPPQATRQPVRKSPSKRRVAPSA